MFRFAFLFFVILNTSSAFGQLKPIDLSAEVQRYKEAGTWLAETTSEGIAMNIRAAKTESEKLLDLCRNAKIRYGKTDFKWQKEKLYFKDEATKLRYESKAEFFFQVLQQDFPPAYEWLTPKMPSCVLGVPNRYGFGKINIEAEVMNDQGDGSFIAWIRGLERNEYERLEVYRRNQAEEVLEAISTGKRYKDLSTYEKDMISRIPVLFVLETKQPLIKKQVITISEYVLVQANDLFEYDTVVGGTNTIQVIRAVKREEFQNLIAEFTPSVRNHKIIYQPRKWVSKSGSTTTEAKIVALEGNKVKLEKADGKVIEVQLDKLSQKDQHWLEVYADLGADLGVDRAMRAMRSFHKSIIE